MQGSRLSGSGVESLAGLQLADPKQACQEAITIRLQKLKEKLDNFEQEAQYLPASCCCSSFFGWKL